jgi:hypothetical protein
MTKSQDNLANPARRRLLQAAGTTIAALGVATLLDTSALAQTSVRGTRHFRRAIASITAR